MLSVNPYRFLRTTGPVDLASVHMEHPHTKPQYLSFFGKSILLAEQGLWYQNEILVSASGCQHDHHIIDKGAAGVASAAVINIRCLSLDTTRMVRLLLLVFSIRRTGSITVFRIRIRTRNWTAKDVERDDSLNKKPRAHNDD